MRHRFVPILLLAALVAAIASLVAGCGGGGSDSSGKDPAEAVPPKAPVLIEASIQPESDVADKVDSLVQKVAGIDDLGALIAEELESSASDAGGSVDFEKEVQPWLGEKAAIFLQEYNGDEFAEAGAALQVTDEGEAEDFIQKRSEEASDENFEEGSFEGVDFEVNEEGEAVGLTEGLLLFAEEEKVFEQMVDALDGENLAGLDAFAEATGDLPDGSLGDVYVDIGKLIKEAGQGIPSETKLGFELLGIEPEEATAVLSLIPGAESLEVDVSSNLSSGSISGGDPSALLGSLPAGSVAAIGSAEYGKALQQMIDGIDENGIPGEVPPHRFKKSLEASGVDIESIVGSIGDIGVFVEGNSQSTLGGALVIESSDQSEAENTVKNLGLLLRASGTPGITAISEGGLSGFSISSDEIGEKPLVVAAGDSRIAISYGPKAAVAALSEKAGTLADDPTFQEAKSALGDTPLSGFLDGAAAVGLFEAIASPLEQGELMEAKPYLEKLGYVAIGGSSSGDSSTAKIIAGLSK